LAELEKIQKLKTEAEDLEKEANDKVNKMPRWAMITSITFFSALGSTALVSGVLYMFDVIPAATSLLFWIVLAVSLGGNCLGSFALFYSGLFKTDLKELAKGMKKLEFASGKTKERVKVLTKHRKALNETHDALEKEINKLHDEIDNFEANQETMNETKIRIEDNTEALNHENRNLKQEKENLRNEEERYDESVADMDNNRKLVEDYNRDALERVGELSHIVQTLKETKPQLDDQLERFKFLRDDVEKISNVMGQEVDQTAKTVREIFEEIRELTIRQERVMLYQMMERIICTEKTRDMGHAAFKRFEHQIPSGYDGHGFDDRWFGQVAVDGRIGHEQLKIMIDTITLSKGSRQARASKQA